MTIPLRILPSLPPAPAELIEGFRQIPVANISDNMNRLFAAGAALRPFHDGTVMCGTALTVRTRPGDNLLVHKALDMARKGDVIVVEAGGDLTNAIIGEIMLRYAASRGVAGFVIDGAIRDLEAVQAGNLPVFAGGVSHRGPYKDGPGEINVPVAIGQTVVEPGSIVVGDADGVVAIPPVLAEAVLVAARRHNAMERDIFKAIADDRFDRSWVDATLRSRGFIA
ncbi:RraA family protein [Devosia ginsengisoli]|uniref:RraA family protein n=1 Tax=Devosia ginsengisoli TaxID=400770 RepID=UPI0026E9E8EB|nr:RraA family protein [Devosia ginsengisoli]MCR6671865.1 RraA family protein [Devosia ginsengisoli]